MDVLCEGNCVLVKYNQKPIEIGRLQRLAMDHFYAARGFAGASRGGRSAAGGLRGRRAGITRLRGRTARGADTAVTIFDNRPLPGGLNTYGVAEYKLRPADSLREVELVRSLGVEFRQAEVGRDLSLDDLDREYAFIFLGLGLGAMERLGIAGEYASGVIDALHFIERYKTSTGFHGGRGG